MNKPLDNGSLVIALLTLVLFVAALFSKGITHDLFLEAGVFLVSVKIIVMAYNSNVAVAQLDHKLDRVLAALATTESRTADRAAGFPHEPVSDEKPLAGE